MGRDLSLLFYHRVFMFDHSGIVLSASSFGCRFDSGQLGFIYEKRSDIRAEFGVKAISPKLRQHILDRLDSEIQLLEYWANGEVYCFSVADESCGGFYGSDRQKSGLIEATMEVIESICLAKKDIMRLILASQFLAILFSYL